MKTNPYACKVAQRMRGMTVLELMVVLSVMAILVGMAVPAMTRWLEEWRVSSAIHAFSAGLQTGRSEAIARGRVVRLCRTKDHSPDKCEKHTSTGVDSSKNFSTGWMVYVDANDDGVYQASDHDQILVQQRSMTGIRDISPVNTPNIHFLPTGLMSNGALALNVDGMGFVSKEKTPWARKALCISMAGRVRVVGDTVDCGSDRLDY